MNKESNQVREGVNRTMTYLRSEMEDDHARTARVDQGRDFEHTRAWDAHRT